MKSKKSGKQAGRVFALLLAFSILPGLFAACNGKNPADNPADIGTTEAADGVNKGWNPVVPTEGETQPGQRTLTLEQITAIAAQVVGAAREGQTQPGGANAPAWDGSLGSLSEPERGLVKEAVKQQTGVDLDIQPDGSVVYPPAATSPAGVNDPASPGTSPAGTPNTSYSYTTRPGGASAASKPATNAPQGGGAQTPGTPETIGQGNLAPAETTQAPAQPGPQPAGMQLAKLSTFGGAGHQRARSVASTPNGGYVVAMLVDTAAPGCPGGLANYATAVQRYTPEGKPEWAAPKFFGGNDAFELTAITVLKDGGIVLAGSTRAKNLECATDPGQNTDAILLKLDGNGNKLWMKSFYGSKEDIFTCIAATPDGGFVVGGYTVSADGSFEGLTEQVLQVGTGFTGMVDAYKAIAIKLDANGTVYSKRVMVGSKFSSFNALTADKTTGDVYASVRSSAKDYDFSALSLPGEGTIMIRFSKGMDTQWMKPFKGSGTEILMGLAAADGGVVAVGYITHSSYSGGSFGSVNSASFFRRGNKDAVALKYNRDGSVAWIRSMGDVGNDEALGVAAVEGGYAISGTATAPLTDVQFKYDWLNHSFGGGSLDSCVWLLRGDGAQVKFLPISGEGNDLAPAVAGNGGRSFMIVGSAGSKQGYFAGASPASPSATNHIAFAGLYSVQYN
ncbi:MAG: hypothetical protein LBC83_01360 [Oscillospiraceae bacterium]|nr:hypothetical protein [Oscillospiraceae bacterium]